jgi:NDP-sugar pyrophosphorylase family protein
MIFAAGRGTRLGPLGEATPKALIEIAGLTMLERAAARLVEAGATRLVVNVHHHAGRIAEFIAGRDLGAEVLVSREPDGPLETGGGLLRARDLLRRDDLILLHNVDVVCGVSLRPLADAQRSGDALATLAVHERETARQLLFDDEGLLGREDRRDGTRRVVRPPRGAVRSLAFAGVHACSPRLLDLFTETGAFPIVDAYLRLAAAGHVIAPWRLDPGRWLEIGSLERLAAARARLEGTPPA